MTKLLRASVTEQYLQYGANPESPSYHNLVETDLSSLDISDPSESNFFLLKTVKMLMDWFIKTNIFEQPLSNTQCTYSWEDRSTGTTLRFIT